MEGILEEALYFFRGREYALVVVKLPDVFIRDNPGVDEDLFGLRVFVLEGLYDGPEHPRFLESFVVLGKTFAVIEKIHIFLLLRRDVFHTGILAQVLNGGYVLVGIFLAYGSGESLEVERDIFRGGILPSLSVWSLGSLDKSAGIHRV